MITISFLSPNIKGAAIINAQHTTLIYSEQ